MTQIYNKNNKCYPTVLIVLDDIDVSPCGKVHFCFAALARVSSVKLIIAVPKVQSTWALFIFVLAGSFLS